MTRLPVTGLFSITAVYGQQGSYWINGHKGIDFVAEDRRVFCTCYGTVRLVAYDAAGWGYYISVGDSEGRRHIFCHLAEGSVKVKAGDAVTPLTVLATMGATGNATGLHLHYQLQQGNTVVDPASYLGIPNRAGSYHSEDFNEEENTMEFKDQTTIPDWAREAVETVSQKGWMVGDDDGNFRPNEPITRAEMAVILSRL
ncbi:MAG: peptidoglycan DD-metalloendopeptidase family protein [Clostridia bacterium]|nr:peptidoglycan DD-metalloendopeptidase family protein [Clostridia bacterium]